MSKHILLTILFIILIHIVNAQNDSIVFKHITNTDGLSSNEINFIFEDSKGLMWIATSGGLDVYDGNSITRINSEIIAKTITENKRNSDLYFACQKGIFLFDRKKHKFILQSFKNKKGEKINYERSFFIAMNDKNELFFTYLSALYIVNPQKTVVEKFEIPSSYNIKSYGINAAFFHKNGQELVGTNTGIFIIDRKKKCLSRILENFIDIEITNIVIDSQENIWVCTSNDGLYCYAGGDFTKKPEYFSSENGTLINNRAKNIVEIAKDKYYIINHDGGLVYFNRKTKEVKHFVPDQHNTNSISAISLLNIAKDSRNNIWIGTLKNGINLIDIHRKKFYHHSFNFKDDGLLSNNIRTIFQDTQGDVWIGTENPASLSKYNRTEGTFKNYIADINKPDALHADQVFCIEELDNNRLLLGTLKNGIAIFNKKTEKFKHLIIPEYKNKVNSSNVIIKDVKNNIWVSTDRTLYKFNPNNNTFTSICNMIKIRSIIQADDNHLWITTHSKGLYHFNINTYESTNYAVPLNDSLNTGSQINSNLLTFVKKGPKGKLWIGTRGAGINIKDAMSDKFTYLTTKDGLIHNHVSDLLFENDSTVWISTYNGLCKYDINSKTFKNFDVHDGLQANQFSSFTGLKAKNGEMYFGGQNGFNVFYPKEIVDNPNIPNILFTDFKLFNKSVLIDTLDSPLKNHISYTKVLTLNHKQSIITFSFVAINYTAPQKIQYAYMLEGFEENWNYIGNKNEASFTNLPPGEYTLRVKASNNDNKWNEEGLSIKLIILPPWWNRWWFRTLSALVIISATILLYRTKMQEMKKEQMILEQTVAEKTRGLQETNIILEENQEEISQQNEELETKQNDLLNSNQEIERNNQVLEEQKEYLKEKHEEVTRAYHIVEEKNNHIKASISYAKTIQNAILPTTEDMRAAFNAFVIFRPKDIVSGDFYWMNRIDQHTCLIAAVDCTGHGVPGAFMSLIGSRLLNTIVNEQQIQSPKEILTAMNKGINKALKQDTSNNDDGMDICLCKIETKDTPKICFSGAKRPLYHYNNQTKEINRIKGTINTIGGNYHLEKHPYTNTEISINKGDCIYLTSDGYIDQNDTRRKNFGMKNFKNLLTTIYHLPIEVQKQKMEEALDNFSKNTKQRDDITVIGIKF